MEIHLSAHFFNQDGMRLRRDCQVTSPPAA